MNSFTKLNLFISILLLFSLIASINEVTSMAIIRRAYGLEMCKGFEFTSPKGGITVKNNTQITVSWKRGTSKVVIVLSIELFTNKGLISTLWVGKQPFGPDGTATVKTKISAPPSLKLPANVMLRTWGETAKGPHCVIFTKPFTLTK